MTMRGREGEKKMCCWVISRSLEFTSSLELHVSVHIRSADGKVSSLYRGVEAHQDWGEQRGLEVVVGGCRWRARAGGRAVVIGRACGGRHRWSWMMLVVTALALSVLRLKAHRDLHVMRDPETLKAWVMLGYVSSRKSAIKPPPLCQLIKFGDEMRIQSEFLQQLDYKMPACTPQNCSNNTTILHTLLSLR